jgi:hypothetical protein
VIDTGILNDRFLNDLVLHLAGEAVEKIVDIHKGFPQEKIPPAPVLVIFAMTQP